MSRQTYNCARKPSNFEPIAEETTPPPSPSTNSLTTPIPIHKQQDPQNLEPPSTNPTLENPLDDATANTSASTDLAPPASSPQPDKKPTEPTNRTPSNTTTDAAPAIITTQASPGPQMTYSPPVVVAATTTTPSNENHTDDDDDAAAAEEKNNPSPAPSPTTTCITSCMIAPVVGAFKTCAAYAACVPCRTEREGCCTQQGCFRLWLNCGPCLALTCCPCCACSRR